MKPGESQRVKDFIRIFSEEDISYYEASFFCDPKPDPDKRDNPILSEITRVWNIDQHIFSNIILPQWKILCPQKLREAEEELDEDETPLKKRCQN